MDQKSSLAEIYDFKSKVGITAILVALRKSEISSAEKNELRDLVFLYTSGGGDDSVRISLEQKLTAHNIRPIVVEVVAPTPIFPFGTLRPVPTFKKLDVSSSVLKGKEDSLASSSNSKTLVEEAIPTVATPKTANNLGVVAAANVSSPTINEVSQVVTPSKGNQSELGQLNSADSILNSIANDPAEVLPVTNSIPQPKIAQSEIPVENSSSVPAPSARPVIPIINTKYLDRIREIKSEVNSKVGNPVNLVDIDNQVGREYMNALLEAMKRLNGGIAGELDAAMARLETAYSAVEKVVDSRSVMPEPAVATAPTKKVIPPPELSSVVPKLSEVPSIPLPKKVTPPVEANDIFIPKMNPVSVNESVVPNTAPKVASSFTPINLASIQVNPDLKKVERLVTNVQNDVVAPIPSPYAERAAVGNLATPASVNPILNRVENKIPTLAESKKLPTFNDVPAVLQTNANEMQNPLYTSEIDAGLEQLLSDWSLFKKSGLFGTGPKGREHPLFKKISGLQIPLLLAGRFEGASQEIRQSITDYMNGWRYEQGIIYEQGETFEIYLRRVIRHIIDLQKRRVAA